MRILQSRGFKSTIKKLHPNQKKDLDRAVRAIATNPLLGEAKIGDLAGTQVYKFKMVSQATLLAFEWKEEEETLVLLALGSHENFYRDLKK